MLPRRHGSFGADERYGYADAGFWQDQNGYGDADDDAPENRGDETDSPNGAWDSPASGAWPDEWSPQAEPAARAVVDRQLPLNLAGNALVVLQSCRSLHDEATQEAIRGGACGAIGSVTNVHSASGSSFVKAWSDAILYRDATAGEALRDARNYFLLLAKLKQARGHREQAKVLRVALSFRLWGDPETRVLPELQGQPTRRPLAGEVQDHRVTLHVPRRKLPAARTPQYVATAFPGSETAGIVKRIKGKECRRLMSLYFVRLERPSGLDLAGFGHLVRDGDSDTRAVFSTDPSGDYLYVLYFPAKEASREKITLEFRR